MAPKLKIFHVITRLSVGGAAHYNILLAKEIHERGHEVWMVHGPAGKNEEEMLDHWQEDRPNYPFVVIPELRRNIHPWYDLIAFFRLVHLFRKERPTVVHTHTSKAGFLGRLAAQVAGIPIVIHSMHGTVFNGFFDRRTSRLFAALERLGARWTDLILSDTSLIRQDLIESRIGRPDRIKVLPLGLDLKRYRDIAPFRGQLRRRLKLNEAMPIIGAVARLVPIKGIRYLLEAVERLKDCLSLPFHCAIVGDGELRMELEELARKLKIEDRVTFVGYWKDLREVYADFDIQVLPSLSEGCPVAILEGMASGKPIVASKVGGIPDVLRDGITGLLVPPCEPAPLADAIKHLLTNPEVSRKLATTAQHDAFERFTIQKSAQATETAYRYLFETKVPL